MTNEIRIDKLPPQMRRIIAAIGIRATELLLIERGGTRIMRPRTHAASQAQAELMGSIALSEGLWAAFPGRGYIDLPMTKKLDAQRRNARILELRGRRSAGDIAYEYRLTTAYVRAIWSENANI